MLICLYIYRDLFTVCSTFADDLMHEKPVFCLKKVHSGKCVKESWGHLKCTVKTTWVSNMREFGSDFHLTSRCTKNTQL